jgi:predicted aldo/keto reductase-like oxidoreductase
VLHGGVFAVKYRELGNTGIMVSEIGMGCEGFGESNCAMTRKLFDLAEERGVNYFDLYTSNPAIRRAVGEAMKGRREKFIVQSHICSVWQDGQYKRTRKISEVKAGFAEMLELLQTDYIDVGMIHYCDALSDWEEIVSGGVLDYARQLKKEGKIRHIGLSSHNPQVALKAVESGAIEVLMFSVNPCYDLQPANEDVEELWAAKNYSGTLTNMDPERQRLYETCQRLGVGITVMKCFGGGDLLDAKLSPAGAALTVNQCIHYALTRPGVAVVLAGAHSIEQLKTSLAYEEASEAEKDYAEAFASFPKISWTGHCMYCSHCAPCPQKIDVAYVTKFLNLTVAQGEIPETVREHYKALEHHAGECIKCGICETRCPFGVKVRENMEKAKSVFGY